MLNNKYIYVLLLLFGLNLVTAKTLRIPSQYITIQTAIDSAASGDTLIIQPGIYKENIVINRKNIVIASHFIYSNNFSDIQNTVIDGNKKKEVIYLKAKDKSILIGLTVANGRAINGGGIICDSSNPKILNCIIRNNSAKTIGGGIYSENGNMFIKNSLILHNKSEIAGGGIASDYSQAKLINCTFFDNTSKEGGAIASNICEIRIKNSIIWKNQNDDILAVGGGIKIRYSIIQRGWKGEKILQSDPIFCDTQNNDFALHQDSPCIGSGENESTIGALGVGDCQ